MNSARPGGFRRIVQRSDRSVLRDLRFPRLWKLNVWGGLVITGVIVVVGWGDNDVAGVLDTRQIATMAPFLLDKIRHQY